jgi:hypothetical protein
LKHFEIAPIWNKLYKAEILKNIRFDEDISIGEDVIFNIEYFKFIKKISVNNS